LRALPFSEAWTMADIPGWLDELVRAVGETMTAQGEPASLGLRFREDEGAWEVLIYPLPVELVGGAHDGAMATPGFSLDVEALRLTFSRVDDLTWNAATAGPGEEGPCLSLEGEYRGRSVWLRVLALAPDDEEPSGRINTNER
jgi:hypothetical protein